ncbi:MAG: DUF4124 domain-containing protein [bacterium]|nr:DUF4124 domain-containing protein [bacterium]
MLGRHSLLALVLVLLVGPTPAPAEVYTWVDEQGKVHFSDTPRGGATRVVPHTEKPAASLERDARVPSKAIPYRGQLPSLRLAVADVEVDLPARGRTRLPVGRQYRGYYCNSGAEDLLVNLERKLKGSTLLPRDFHRRLAELAYQPPEFASTGRKKVTIADLQAVPTVTRLSLRSCMGRGRRNGQSLPNKNLVEVRIHWRVFDRLSQQTVFEGTTEARFDRWNQEYLPEEKDKGIVTATRHALLAAAEKLLADPEFVAVLSPDGSLPAQEESTPAALTEVTPDFQNLLPQVRSATPMIRTVRRNGHGVLISDEGHVLTNYRVVADGREVTRDSVMVVFESESIPGRVVRSDKPHRVALILLERIPGIRPVPIASSGVRISEPVFVLGGPLEDSLEHTLSEGVITTVRNLRGSERRYYHTNAPVDRDNPTGPVLNQRGELVALATGLGFSRTPGANYLIPIDDALEALGVSRQQKSD